MSKDNKPSAEALASYIADELRADPEAEKEFRADPKKFLEEKSGKTLPEGVQVKIEENSDKTWHIPLGGDPGPLDTLHIPLGGNLGPLDEAELDNFAGGYGHKVDKERSRRHKDYTQMMKLGLSHNDASRAADARLQAGLYKDKHYKHKK